MSIESGVTGMQLLLQLPTRPDGVFAANDFTSVGAMSVIQERGMRIPDDIAVSGFSNELFTSLTAPRLTTVDQRCEQMGQAAVRLFLEIRDAEQETLPPRQIVLQPELLVRTSSLRQPSTGQA